ncbi:MAG: ATP-binding protein [Actinomycetota bacterium]|nr:ATP-binding protein [Actinomycetota bacterium]
MDELLALRLRPQQDAARRARQALAPVLGALDPDIRSNVSLLASELVTSSVRRLGQLPAETIVLRVVRRPTVLRVEVRDPGPLFPPPVSGQSSGWSILQETGPAGDPTGWGLYIVNRLASRWGITVDRGTEVWFELDVRD